MALVSACDECPSDLKRIIELRHHIFSHCIDSVCVCVCVCACVCVCMLHVVSV